MSACDLSSVPGNRAALLSEELRVQRVSRSCRRKHRRRPPRKRCGVSYAGAEGRSGLLQSMYERLKHLLVAIGARDYGGARRFRV
jgi:hypothetical protein